MSLGKRRADLSFRNQRSSIELKLESSVLEDASLTTLSFVGLESNLDSPQQLTIRPHVIVTICFPWSGRPASLISALEKSEEVIILPFSSCVIYN